MLSELDATDRRILGVLQKDGRITNADLSDQVNLSPSACHRRVERLEKDGFIAGYVALLDARRLGKPTTVFVDASGIVRLVYRGPVSPDVLTNMANILTIGGQP